jgi:hypothetical protein
MADATGQYFPEGDQMRSNSIFSSNPTAGGIKIWTAILILALACVIAVVALQVQEYLFYEKPPSLWHKPGSAPTPVPEISPPAQSALSTSAPIEPDAALTAAPPSEAASISAPEQPAETETSGTETNEAQPESENKEQAKEAAVPENSEPVK